MDYERMWRKLERNLVIEAGNKGMEPGAAKHCRNTILAMSEIESEEYENDSKARGREYTIRQNITKKMDSKVLDIGKIARESFERMTGCKVIDSLKELENEIQKRIVKAPFPECLVVDEKVDIPTHIYHEAKVRGIRIVRFGTDVMFSGGVAGAK